MQIIWIALLFLLPVPAQAQQENGSQRKGPPAALVETAPVQRDTVRSPLTLVGTAEPRFLATVAAEGEGRVESFPARQGELVNRGDALARMRTLPLELRMEEMQARLAEVKARIDKAQADAARAEKLFEQQFISEEELQTRTTEYQALERQREQIAAEIRLLKDQLQRLEVRAPFTGRVVEEKTELGQWLGEGDPVAVLADLSVMHVMVPVPEQSISGIGRGDAVEVRFDALPDRTFTGEVTSIVPQADPATRTFPVQVSVKNPDGRILSGMLARVTFFSGEPRSTLLVPKDAFVPQPQGGGYVVKVQDGKATYVPVRVETSQGNLYAVEPVGGEELAAEDRVVVRGNERLRPGQGVRETEESP